MGSFIVTPYSNVISVVESQPGYLGTDNPVVGYDNRVAVSTLTADLADDDYPVTNLANPSTAEKWASIDGYPQVIEARFGTAKLMDYVAFARHNFNSAAIGVSIDGALSLDMSGEPVYTELISESTPYSDGPAIFRFTPQLLYAVRIRFTDSDDPPEAAVMYSGKLLVLERRLYVGHTPIPYGRRVTAKNAVSENGHFLGSITTRVMKETSVAIQHVSPEWYRTDLDPFFQACHTQRLPFFFAWRPETYPNEVGYGWMKGDPQVTNQLPSGFMSASWNMGGIDD